MKLTKKAIKKIRFPETRLKLALALGVTEGWIVKLLDQNKDNGLLTTVLALRIIIAETGLNQDDILEGSAIRAVNI